MTRKSLKKIIKEVMAEETNSESKVLPPNSPGVPFKAGTESVSVSNFSTHQLNVTAKIVSGVIFIDIRDS